MEEACGWVGRDHATRIVPPPVQICGLCDPIGGYKGGSKKGRRAAGEEKVKKGGGLGMGKEGLGFFFKRVFLSSRVLF